MPRKQIPESSDAMTRLSSTHSTAILTSTTTSTTAVAPQALTSPSALSAPPPPPPDPAPRRAARSLLPLTVTTDIPTAQPSQLVPLRRDHPSGKIDATRHKQPS
ncbi:hypothetical protein Vafri_16297 [Volvox africanus]|uniref:Uncharacterized protein n=1 Tax=Volvox africanus TaxID=51714 RepID=A0A8J4BMZ0_9CHLO|nr:hypothetical protein Vafri_16297 [Volvox africanus]